MATGPDAARVQSHMKFAPIFIAVLLFAVQRIEAQQVLDQEQTQYYGGLSARTLPGYAVGQSFTAGLTGTMTEIDMGFFNNIAGNGRLIIFTGAGPEGTILETLPVTVTSITGTGVSWNDWTVDVPVVAGSQYTFMFTPNAATIPDPYGVCIGSEDSYAGGNLYLQDSSGAVTKFFQSVFRTYVDVKFIAQSHTGAVARSRARRHELSGIGEHRLGGWIDFRRDARAHRTRE